MAMIQWFPGHMVKAAKDLRDLVGDIDIVLELLDARAPLASCNQLLQDIAKYKKKIYILNKSDLADESITKQWLDYFNQQGVMTICGNKNDKTQRSNIMKLCRSLAPHRRGFEKPLRVMIAGIPNVGKSTLINQLSISKSAKTGDIPAVTKVNQRLAIENDFLIYDTPGLMWQKILYPQVGYHLGLCNSIGRNALDEELLALYLINYLVSYYIDDFAKRYKLDINHIKTIDANSILELIALKRGCLISGGGINIQKVSEILIQDFRQTKIARISLETPKLWEDWLLWSKEQDNKDNKYED